MRKPIGLFVAAFATVAGGGLAVAVEGTSSVEESEETPTTLLEEDELDADADADADDSDADDSDDDADDSDADDSDDDAEEDDPSLLTVEVVDPEVDGEYENHGEWVSEHAQETCRQGEETTEETTEGETTEDAVVEEDVVEEDVVEWRNHGECVSNAARDHDHDGTPDHGPGSPDHPVFPAEEPTAEETSADTAEADTADADEAPRPGRGRGNGGGNGGGNGRRGR